MIGLLNSCSGFVSATALLQVAGSASMFGWLLLLPSTEFPGAQEPATVAVLAETVPQEESGPIGSPLVCAPQSNSLPRGSFPVVSRENAAQLQEMMALRARVGTGLGSAEEFQVALVALIQEDSQETRSTSPTTSSATSPATLPNWAASVAIQPTHPPICVDAVQLNSYVNQPLEGSFVAAAPIWVQRQYENLVQQWMPPHGQQQHGQQQHGQQQHGQQQHGQQQHGQQQHGQQQPGQSPHWPPQYGQPNDGQLTFVQPPYVQPPYVQPPYVQPPHVQPPHVQPPHVQPPHVQPPHAPSQMTVPNVVSNQLFNPQNAPLQILPGQELGSVYPHGRSPVPGQWQEFQHEHASGRSISPGTFHRTQHIHFQDPHPQFAPSSEQPSENRGPSVRVDSIRSPDNHRPDNGPGPNSRPDAPPEQTHRIRHAARMLEESAWELEEAGEYSLADDVRRQAGELYRRARGQGRDLVR